MTRQLKDIFNFDRYMILTLGSTFLASLLLVSIFICQIGLDTSLCPTSILFYLSDAMILWLPSLLLWPRAKQAETVVLFVVSVFFYCSTLHYRSFGIAMPAADITLISTVDSIIIQSAAESMKYSDIIFLLPALISALAVRLWGNKTHSPMSEYLKIAYAAVCIASLLLFHGRMYRAERNVVTDLTLKTYFYNSRDTNSHIQWRGIIVGYILDALSSKMFFHEMPARDIQEIKQWSEVDGTASARAGKDKNLILIIIESLNTKAIEWNIDGRSAMPRLNELIADTSAITFTSVYPQAGAGRSSDGQMMYYTGIYPCFGKALSIVAPSGPYPSLCRIRPWRSFEVIGDKKTMWNHSMTNKALAFDHIYDNCCNFAERDDRPVFEAAKTIIERSPRPFFCSVITIAMHPTYHTEPKEKLWLSDIPFDDPRDRCYLEICARTDAALGDFTDWLKATGLWQQSVIVIASDHEVQSNCIGPEMREYRILFTIINSGHKGFRSDAVVGQIDVYPTIIDALGEWDNTIWHGFGHSLLRTVPGFAITYHGNVAGDTIGKSADIARQRRAVELSQKWIFASNKDRLIFDKRQDR